MKVAAAGRWISRVVMAKDNSRNRVWDCTVRKTENLVGSSREASDEVPCPLLMFMYGKGM